MAVLEPWGGEELCGSYGQRDVNLRYRAILFDLDGTLVDTLDDLTAAMNYGLRRLGLPEHPAEVCRRMIGNGVDIFASRALGPDHQDLHGRLIEVMMPYYEAHCMDRSRVYEGVHGVLAELHRRGIRVAVVTNKDQPQAEKVMGHYFADGLFDAIVGVGPQVPVKPDPTGTRRVLDTFGVGSDQALFIGDSEIDYETAENAGVRFVGAAWGFRGRPALARLGVKTIIERPGEILNLLS